MEIFGYDELNCIGNLFIAYKNLRSQVISQLQLNIQQKLSDQRQDLQGVYRNFYNTNSPCPVFNDVGGKNYYE